MPITRRSLIAGSIAGAATVAMTATSANARERFIEPAISPSITKVPTPAVGHAIKRGGSMESLASINSITVSPDGNIIPGYGNLNLNGDSWGTSRVCLSAFDRNGNSITNPQPAGSEEIKGFYAEGRIYLPLLDPSQPAGFNHLHNRTAVWESDIKNRNWVLRDIVDPQGNPYRAEHVTSICSAPNTDGTLFIAISSHRDNTHGFGYEDGVILAGDFEGGFVPIYISSAPNQGVHLLPTEQQVDTGAEAPTVRATRTIKKGGKQDITLYLGPTSTAPTYALKDEEFQRHWRKNAPVVSAEHQYKHDWGVYSSDVRNSASLPNDTFEFGNGWRFEPGNIKADRNVAGIQGYIRHRDASRRFNLAIPNEEHPEKDMGILHTYMRSNSEVWHAIRSQFGDLTIINTMNGLVWHVNKGDFKRYKSADTKEPLRNELLKVSGDSFGVLLTGNSGNPKFVFGTTDGYLIYIEGLLPYTAAKDMLRRPGTNTRFGDDYEYETYKYGMSLKDYRANDAADIRDARRMGIAQGLRARSYYKRVAD